MQDVTQNNFFEGMKANCDELTANLQRFNGALTNKLFDPPALEPINEMPNDDRNLYLWLKSLPLVLQRNVNGPIDWLNNKPMPWYHMPENVPTADIILGQPGGLSIDASYRQQWQVNWQMISTAVTKIEDILKANELVE